VKSRGYLFSGSNECYKVAQFVQNSGSEVKNVGLLVPNELGFYDMSGNVWEWVQDSYHQYGSTEVQNQNIHVQRGGSASSKWDACRVANRQQMNAGNIKNTFGFRIAL
jgi:formylglycine-generating enzyme required for sulfatase activity